MDSTLALGALRIARGAGGEGVREREPRRAGEGRLVWNRNFCALIDYRLWAAKSEGRQWVDHCIDLYVDHCIDHHPEPRSGLWVLAGGAEGSFLCSLITDFLAEGAGWGASPGRGGELGCLRAGAKGTVKYCTIPHPSHASHSQCPEPR